MAENLTNDTAVMLIANTLATGAGLFVLITVFADVSGAHFNPFVSIAMTITGKLKKRLLPFYISAQILGCLLGVALANFFFEHQIFELSTKSRDGIYIFTSEIVATFGLILIIFGSMKSGKLSSCCISWFIYHCWLLVYFFNIFCKSSCCISTNLHRIIYRYKLSKHSILYIS